MILTDRNLACEQGTAVGIWGDLLLGMVISAQIGCMVMVED